jgi:hypothetical protein
MIKEAYVATLLAKAKEAEAMAEKAKDAKVRQTWLSIAAGYRELARLE